MNVCVIGAGYVGLVTGACLAALGNKVLCIDHDLDRINLLQRGEIFFYEPGLQEIVTKNLQEQRLLFSADYRFGIENAAIIFITVDTPPNEDGSADLTKVFKVVAKVGEYLNSDKLIIIKSTVPVGTCARVKAEVARILEEKGKNFKFEVVSNPEFLREGSAVRDFMNPDRIVVGSNNPQVIDLIRNLYSSIMERTGCPLLVMDPQSAEITKYAANGLLATKISFINELAKLAELTDADITKVSSGVGGDPRIGPSFLQAGLGYGGSCFPKDVKSLTRTLVNYGLNPGLLKAVEEINQSQQSYFLQKIKTHFHGDLKGKILAVWGLSFKPETDDLREAPSKAIIDGLLAEGAIIRVFDPKARLNSKELTNWAEERICSEKDQYVALAEAEALIIITEWDCFKQANLEKVARLLKNRVIFDGRNLFEPKDLQKLGFQYYSIGRG